MSSIDIPAQKQILWHRMRADLISLVPWFEGNDLLLCPTCCRAIGFDEFSVEHIVPKQALASDPVSVREAVPRNDRSGLTLLCRRQLVYKNKRLPGIGCNSWKGKHYDGFLRDLLKADIKKQPINTGHQTALFAAGFLALVREFGYQIALSPMGLVSRSQFFNPCSFIKEMPLMCQMMLTGDRRTDYNEAEKGYWSEPFRITVDETSAHIVLRNIGFRLPLSRDPRQPFARALRYTPSKYAFRPDLTTAFR